MYFRPLCCFAKENLCCICFGPGWVTFNALLANTSHNLWPLTTDHDHWPLTTDFWPLSSDHADLGWWELDSNNTWRATESLPLTLRGNLSMMSMCVRDFHPMKILFPWMELYGGAIMWVAMGENDEICSAPNWLPSLLTVDPANILCPLFTWNAPCLPEKCLEFLAKKVGMFLSVWESE